MKTAVSPALPVVAEHFCECQVGDARPERMISERKAIVISCPCRIRSASGGLLCLLCGVFLLTSCTATRVSTGDSLYYSDQDHRFGAQSYCRFESPIILAGEIMNIMHDTVNGRMSPYGYPLTRVRLNIKVEDVLKGSVPSGQCDVWGYALSTGGLQIFHMNPAVPDFRKGERRLFFLRRTKNHLRLARDVFDYSLPLPGSAELPTRHAHLEPRSKAVALLLQFPSADRAERWAKEIPLVLAEAAQIIGPKALDQFISAEKLVETAPAALRPVLRSEVESFRFSHPARVMRNFAPPLHCLDFGQN